MSIKRYYVAIMTGSIRLKLRGGGYSVLPHFENYYIVAKSYIGGGNRRKSQLKLISYLDNISLERYNQLGKNIFYIKLIW
jgi:hypothetical protein